MSALLCAVFLGACASPKGKVRAQKDPSYTGKLERVLIVSYNEEQAAPQLGRNFSETLFKRLSESLAQRGVVSEIVRPNKAELDENAPIRAAAARFRPRQTLYFGVTRVDTHTGVYRSTATDLPHYVNDARVTFAFSLIDVGRNQTVWRGELYYYVLPDPKTVADQFAEQLAAEQFLGNIP